MGPGEAGGCGSQHAAPFCLTGQKPLPHGADRSDQQGLSLSSYTNTDSISAFKKIIFQGLERKHFANLGAL